MPQRFFQPAGAASYPQGSDSVYDQPLGRQASWMPGTGTAGGYQQPQQRFALPPPPPVSAPPSFPNLGSAGGGGQGVTFQSRDGSPSGGGGLFPGGISDGSTASRYANIFDAYMRPRREGERQAVERFGTLVRPQVETLDEQINERGFAPKRSSISLNARQKLYETQQMSLNDLLQRGIAEEAGVAGQFGMAALQTDEARRAADTAYLRDQAARDVDFQRNIAMLGYQNAVALWSAQNEAAQRDYANRVNLALAMQPSGGGGQAAQEPVPAYAASGTIPFQSRGGVVQTQSGPALDPRSMAWGVGLPGPRAAAPAGWAGGGMPGMPGMQGGGGMTQAQIQQLLAGFTPRPQIDAETAAAILAGWSSNWTGLSTEQLQAIASGQATAQNQTGAPGGNVFRVGL